MTVIYVLIPIAILLTIIGIYLFFWAVKTEQFTDLEKQGMSILYDDEKTSDKQTTNQNNERLEREQLETEKKTINTSNKHHVD